MIYDALVGDPAVDEHFTDAAHLEEMLFVEGSLARVQAALGIIPQSAADAISKSTNEDEYDLEALSAGAAKAGNLAIPLVQEIAARVARIDDEAARYVHWGATSQDIIDTATVLQLRIGVQIVADSIARAADAAAQLAERHATTVMAGRTWLQHATPITFGLKAAGWLAALDRVHERVDFALDDAMFLQFGGASGTLASYGDRGIELTAMLANELALRQSDLPWHAHRDRFADLACALGVAVGTMGKIARDIALLSQTEVAEAFEAAEEGKGSSSTMPQKRNPVGASVVLAASIRVPGLVATMLAAMPNEHERALGGWQAEWETLPQIVRLVGGAARHTAEMLGGLEVDVQRMRANLEMMQGVSLSESVSMALATRIGRFDAHQTIRDASRRALAEHRPLADVLAEMPEVAEHLSRKEIERLLEPAHYLGATATFIGDALAAHERYRDGE